ncbi:hypothetical protein JW711_05430 [Candidatus Woesearchaeota archaeon]|nr:hypothetical protein [Candidatus Woesearchaeota archaeon]
MKEVVSVPISNEDLYEEVKELKKLVKQSINLSLEIKGLQEDIKLFEGRQAQDEEKIASAVKTKRFSSIFEWKNAIWERCPNKKEEVGTNTVTFKCTLLKGPCMFEKCPRNFLDEDPYHR